MSWALRRRLLRQRIESFRLPGAEDEAKSRLVARAPEQTWRSLGKQGCHSPGEETRLTARQAAAMAACGANGPCRGELPFACDGATRRIAPDHFPDPGPGRTTVRFRTRRARLPSWDGSGTTLLQAPACYGQPRKCQLPESFVRADEEDEEPGRPEPGREISFSRRAS